MRNERLYWGDDDGAREARWIRDASKSGHATPEPSECRACCDAHWIATRDCDANRNRTDRTGDVCRGLARGAAVSATRHSRASSVDAGPRPGCAARAPHIDKFYPVGNLTEVARGRAVPRAPRLARPRPEPNVPDGSVVTRRILYLNTLRSPGGGNLHQHASQSHAARHAPPETERVGAVFIIFAHTESSQSGLTSQHPGGRASPASAVPAGPRGVSHTTALAQSTLHSPLEAGRQAGRVKAPERQRNITTSHKHARTYTHTHGMAMEWRRGPVHLSSL